MVGWDAIRRAVAQCFRLQHDEDGWIAGFPRDCGDLDDQLVSIEQVTAHDTPWLLIMSPVCYEQDLPHRAALVHNLQLTVGTLALDGQRYELKHALPMSEADEDTMCRRMFALAVEARRLRGVYQSRTEAIRLLSNFED